jgi:hypothetical protein
MFVTEDLKTEVIIPDWQTMPRGDRWLAEPYDVMVDIDEVVCPTIDSIHQIAFERGIHDNSQPMRTWRGHEQYGIPEEAYWDLWSDFALSGGYTNTPPIEGAVEALRRLYWAGHRIHLVTARGFMNHASDIRTWTPQWVEEFAIPHHSLAFARNKVEVQGMLGVKFNYAFDDSPSNTQLLRADGVTAYLVNHPHNETFEYDLRVPSLAAGIDLILKEDA